MQGLNLFHKVILFVLFVYCVWSVSLLIATYFYKPQYIEDTLKGHFCTGTNITNNMEEDFVKFSVQPKIHATAGTMIHLGFLTFFFFASQSSSRKYKIIKIQQNFMTLKVQTLLNIPVLIYTFSDQLVMNVLLETFYNNLGRENVFKIWTSYWLIAGFSKLIRKIL